MGHVSFHQLLDLNFRGRSSLGVRSLYCWDHTIRRMAGWMDGINRQTDI